MKADNLDVSYKMVKQSSGLFGFAVLFILVVKPILEKTSFQSLSDFFIGISVFASGIISMIGFVYALKGSQYGHRNPKKRFFGIFGNFIFAFLLIMLIVANIYDLGKLMSMEK